MLRITEIWQLFYYSSVFVLLFSAPKCISDLLTAYKPSRPLRASDTGLLTVRMIRNKCGEEAFGYYGPTLWNKLPDDSRCNTTVFSFENELQNLPVLSGLWLARASTFLSICLSLCLFLSLSLPLSLPLSLCVTLGMCGWVYVLRLFHTMCWPGLTHFAAQRGRDLHFRYNRATCLKVSP